MYVGLGQTDLSSYLSSIGAPTPTGGSAAGGTADDNQILLDYLAAQASATGAESNLPAAQPVTVASSGGITAWLNANSTYVIGGAVIVVLLMMIAEGHRR